MQSIKRRYYIQLCLYVFFSIGFIVTLTFLIIYRNTFSTDIIPYLLITIFSIAEIGFLYTLIKYLKDFNCVRKNSFDEITGKIVRYKRNQDPESGQQINTRAIVIGIDSNKEIEILVVEGIINCNEIYTFIYLKYTRIGAVKNF